LLRREEAIGYRHLRVLAALALLLAADRAAAAAPNLGRDVAATCAGCHGTDGRSQGGVPGLAGRDRSITVQQMKAFREGRRPSTVMQQIANGYTDLEIEAAAACFAAQKSN
jgi:sulfide dehydrogenase cytochrome subunit